MSWTLAEAKPGTGADGWERELIRENILVIKTEWLAQSVRTMSTVTGVTCTLKGQSVFDSNEIRSAQLPIGAPIALTLLLHIWHASFNSLSFWHLSNHLSLWHRRDIYTVSPLSNFTIIQKHVSWVSCSPILQSTETKSVMSQYSALTKTTA